MNELNDILDLKQENVSLKLMLEEKSLQLKKLMVKLPERNF
jgi:hypothetical protein